MSERRFALVVGSQCQAMPRLSFLPVGKSPDVTALDPERRLVMRLLDLLVDEAGGFAPLKVPGVTAPGLLLNPTQAEADAVLSAGLTHASEQEAVLLVHFLGHGVGHQGDPVDQARHLLHVWDTIEAPIDSEPESKGWDPYGLVNRRRPHLQGLVGLILLVDACNASWAKPVVDLWGGVGVGLLSAWVAASGDHAAWDACLTRTTVELLKHGLAADHHPRQVLVPELAVTDLELVAHTRCLNQTPSLGGYQAHNPVLNLGRNRRADNLADELGLSSAARALTLRLTGDYVDLALDPVIEAVRTARVVGVEGKAGTGKSTFAAALRNPPLWSEMPVGLVQAAVFAATTRTLIDVAADMQQQLTRLPGFAAAVQRHRHANPTAWENQDPWQRSITEPLAIFAQPVRLLVDGLDQFEQDTDAAAILHALTDLVTDERLRHVSLVVTSRHPPDLPGLVAIAMPELGPAAAAIYLNRRHVPPERHQQLTTIADGNWLVLKLLADLADTHPASAPTNLDEVYAALLEEARTPHGPLVDAVLAVLAAAGTGPVLPFDLLNYATADLIGAPVPRAHIHLLLGDLYPVLDRSRPGDAAEHVGLFHQTLVTHIHQTGDAATTRAHEAITAAINDLAPASRHRPAFYRDDPLLAYAFDAGPTHRAAAKDINGLVADLEAREDTHPRVNLARWATWADVVRTTLGSDHPDTLTTRSNHARWTGDAGDPKAARDLYTALLPDLQRALGPDHPDTLTCRGNVALWTGVAGDRSGARALYTALLPDRVRALGRDDPDTLTTRNDLAYWTGQAGDAEKAAKALAELLPDRVRVLGPDHRATLTTRNDLALWTGEAGDPAGARDQFAKLLTDRERALGRDDPDTLTTRNDLALWTGEAGDPEAARDQFAELLPNRVRALGPDHPVTLTTRNELAYWTGQAGDAAKAAKALAELLPDRVRVLGPDHRATLTTRNDLALWTGKAGDPAGARDQFAELLPDRVRVLGPDHRDTLTTRNDLARWTELAPRSGEP